LFNTRTVVISRNPPAALNDPSTKPNWIFLAYLLSVGAALLGAVLLASLTVVSHVVRGLGGRAFPDLDPWLAPTAMLALGVLPWPGLIAILSTALVPRPGTGTIIDAGPSGPAVVVLTALNDEESIGDAVRDFLAAPGVVRVVVVDNGSTDQTAARASAAGARVVLEPRRGYGHACRRALAEGVQSGQPVVILCEGDRTFRAADAERLTAYLRHADLVVGSRTNPVLLSGDSQLNSFLTIGNLFIAQLLQFRYWNWVTGGPTRFTDVGCTYRALRADMLAQILPAFDVGENHFSPHMLMVALEHNLRIIEIPVTFWKRIGRSKGASACWRSGFTIGLSMIWHILTYRVGRASTLRCAEEERLSHAVSP
jgi:hypothetical protein